MPNQPMPAMPMTQAAPQPAPWQAAPPLANLASGVNPQPLPAKVRGVSAEIPAAPKFNLPSPEALGVSASASHVAVKAPVDWVQIQARMQRLNVLEYQKTPLSGGVRVTMLLPTSDPALGQPVEAQAESEATAILMALDAAEAWARKR